MDEMILNKVGSEAVFTKTGKHWLEWLEFLDLDGCLKMNHKEIVAILSQKYHVGDWWCQMVTVGYEQARGLREVHQKTNGYEISATKTIYQPVEKVYNAWVDAGQREKWLNVEGYEIRKVTENKSIRIALQDGSRVDVNLYPKGLEKVQVSLQHNQVSNSNLLEKMKAFWVESLTNLQKLLEE